MTTDPCSGQVLVGCLAVLPRLEVAALPAFGMVRDFVLSIEGGPLVSLAFAVNVLAALTGSASGRLTIALELSAKPIDSSLWNTAWTRPPCTASPC